MREGHGEWPVEVSVVVVSHRRPRALRRCLLSLWLQDYPRMEVVVVADSSGLDAIADLPFAHRLKTDRFDQPGISRARNRGIALATGEIVAFVDDDSAAHPDWVTRLASAFSDADVIAATGHVLGRNGTTVQWGGTVVDRTGQERPFSPSTIGERAEPGCIKLLGTNMAIRRRELVHLGGFDVGYRYFMDDTDLSLRLAARPGATVVVQAARVQHEFLANACRRSDRAPFDLTEIGASSAHFLRLHCPAAHRSGALQALRQEMKRRALRHMVSGRLEPGDIARLMATFDRGAREGANRQPEPVATFPHGAPSFLQLRNAAPAQHRIVMESACARPDDILAEAADLARDGHAVVARVGQSGTSLTQRRFTDDGFWLETASENRPLSLEGLFRYVPRIKAGFA